MVAMAKPAGALDGGGGQGARQPVSQRTSQPDPFWYTAKTKLARAAAGQRAARRAAAVQAARARRAVARRHLLLGVRHRGNPHRAAADRRPGGVHPDPAADAGHLAGDDARGALLPRGRHGLHQAGRLLRGRPGELRPAHRADLRGGAADRLRGHGRGPDRGGHRRRGVRDPRHRPVQAGDLRRRRAADVLRQPARHQGGGQGVRRAHLPVLRRGDPDDRGRPDPRGLRQPAPCTTRPRCTAPTPSAPAPRDSSPA